MIERSELERFWIKLTAATSLPPAELAALPACVVEALCAAIVLLLDVAHEIDWDPMDGDGIKAPRPGEAHERSQRTDPSDGLRPMREARD